MLGSSAYLSGLEMGVNIVCNFKNRQKTRFVDYFFLPVDKNKTQLSLSRRACEVVGDVS